MGVDKTPSFFSSPLYRQSWVCSGIMMSWIAQGCSIGYPATLLYQLKNEDHYELTDEMESWIASTLGVGLIPGTLMSPYIMAKFGRRKANITSIITLGIGWLLVLSSNNIYTMCLGRFLKGVGMSQASVISGVTVSECTSPKNRGYFSVISLSVSFAFGILFVHLTGTYLTWRQTAGFCFMFPIIGFIVFLFSPETPFWLASQKRYKDSRKSFYWLRGETEETTLELETMVSARIVENESKPQSSLGTDIKYLFNSLFRLTLLKPFFVVFHLFLLCQCAGLNVFSAYSITILKKLVKSDFDPYIYLMFIDSIRLMGVVIATVMTKRFSRRRLLFTSGLSTMTAMILISVCSYLRTVNQFDNSSIVISLLICYTFCVILGIGPLPFVICGELFPMEVKAIGNCLGLLVLNTLLFVFMKTAPGIINGFGIHYFFGSYACGIAYCMLVLWFVLPETRNRTLLDIETEFKRVKFADQLVQKC